HRWADRIGHHRGGGGGHDLVVRAPGAGPGVGYHLAGGGAMRARLWRRQAASTPGASLLIMGIVLVAALLLTAWPRLVEQTFIDEAEHQIASAGTTQRAITGTIHQGPLGLAHEPHTIAAALDEIIAGAGPHL